MVPANHDARRVFHLAGDAEGDVDPERLDEDGVEEREGEEFGNVKGGGFTIARGDEGREDFGADRRQEGGGADDFVKSPCGDRDGVGDDARFRERQPG